MKTMLLVVIDADDAPKLNGRLIVIQSVTDNAITGVVLPTLSGPILAKMLDSLTPPGRLAKLAERVLKLFKR